MNFKEFKEKYQKVPVVKYPNKRQGKKPVVAVKVVTYNHADYIRQCLDSVLMQQTNFDFEILIAEDESNDGTREICIEYAEKHPDKISLFLNSRKNNIHINGKPTGIFNNAYANYNLHSKYSCLIEGDDYWVDEVSLQKRYDFLESNEGYVLCFHNIKIIEKGEVVKQNLLPYHKNTTITANEMLNKLIPTNTIMQRNFITNYFNEERKEIICGDMVTKAELSLYGKAMYLHDIKSSVYRKHAEGIFGMKEFSYRFYHTIKAANHIINIYKEKKVDLNSAKKSLLLKYWEYFLLYLKENRKLNFSLLKEGEKLSEKLEISFFMVILGDIIKRIKG